MEDEGCKTLVGVEVQDTKNGATHYWTLEKLRCVRSPVLVLSLRSILVLIGRLIKGNWLPSTIM